MSTETRRKPWWVLRDRVSGQAYLAIGADEQEAIEDMILREIGDQASWSRQGRQWAFDFSKELRLFRLVATKLVAHQVQTLGLLGLDDSLNLEDR